MHISSLSIRNFRNFKKGKLIFKKGINTVIGENGAGKTNIFKALRILIDDSLPRYFKFNSGDFNRSLGMWHGHWIIISIEFDELDESEEMQVLGVQSSGHMDGEDKGSYAVYFRPRYEFRKLLYDYSNDKEKDLMGLRLILDEITIENYETVYLGRGIGDFSDDEIYKKYVGDFEEIIFPDPDNKEEQIFGTWLPKEINIHNEVSCTFIKALRDVESDLKSYSNNPLLNLLRGKEKTVSEEEQNDIIESIDALNSQIGSLEEVRKIRLGIEKSMQEAVGTTYAPNIDIRSELPNEMEKLFQSLKLWVGDPDEEGYKGRIWELSLGGANIVYLSLKLLEYSKGQTNKIANFLLIEEPEAHIHTHIQKTLFNNLKTNKTQVIISTHSTHISSVSRISHVNILCRGDKEANIFHPSNNLEDEKVARIERYLDAVRSNLLFAKGVLLVEGDAEQIVIPEMFKKVFGIALDEIGVSLINIGSTSFENIALLFHADRIRKNCAIITDEDKSIIDLPNDPSGDDDFQKHCRASEKSGRERKKLLEDLCDGNAFLKPFYASHTFEVDFLTNENDFEVSNCLKKIYTREADIQASKEKLKDSSIEISGKEILRIAQKCGKGWFALLLSEELVYNTYIPQYILEAVAFASSHINISSKAKSARYRIQSMRKGTIDDLKLKAQQFKDRGLSDEELVLEFSQVFTEDQLTEFISLL